MSVPGDTLLVAYHGILTGMTEPTWPWRLEDWVMRHATWKPVVISDHYRAGPFPWWNAWVKNPRHGKALANRIRMLEEPGVPLTECEHLDQRHRIVMVGHSNGCCILLDALHRLCEVGIRVDKVLFIGAAIDNDPVKNGIHDRIYAGQLGSAEAWWSPQDHIVGMPAPLRWPYGNLGRTGWKIDRLSPRSSLSVTARLHNVCWPGYGHNGYFRPAALPGTLAAIADSLNIPHHGPAPLSASIDQ